MSARDSFFEKVNKNNETDNKFRDNFNRELKEFQDSTQQLIKEIQSWFEGSSILSITSQQSIPDSIERGRVNTVQSLTLKNGEKTLTLVPEGLRFIGITGALKLSITNMSKSPNKQTFMIHMRDRAPRAKGLPEGYEGWVIVTSSNEGRIVTAFNEENFFATIESFA